MRTGRSIRPGLQVGHSKSASGRKTQFEAVSDEANSTRSQSLGTPRGLVAYQERHEALPLMLAVAMVPVDTDGRVLMAWRTPGKAIAGLWQFLAASLAPT